MTAGAADASFISSSPDPLLGGNRVPTSGVPAGTPWGYATYYVSNIVETGSVVTGGSNILDYTYTEYFTFYTTPSMTTVATSAVFAGQYELTIPGRTSSYETGTFNFTYTASATGTVNGDTVVLRTDPSIPATGTTSITPGPGVGEYTIDTTTTVTQQYSSNGGAWITAPSVSATSVPLGVTSAVPEPSAFLSAMSAVAVLGAVGFIRRSRRT